MSVGEQAEAGWGSVQAPTGSDCRHGWRAGTTIWPARR